MSTLNVDKVDPSTGTALEIGSSGDTVTVPSGATLTVSGTMNASSITAGTMATARLGSGPASSSTVLYGDQTYKTEPGLTGWTTGGTSNSLIPSATDQGIYLGVSSATAANLLDDYEEGTWTMDWQDASANSATYHNNTGYYTKIGDRVYVSGFINVNTMGSCSGSMKLKTLPFTCNNDSGGYSAGNVGYCTSAALGTAGYNVTFHIVINDTQMEPRLWDSTSGNTVLQATEITAGCAMSISGQYHTA